MVRGQPIGSLVVVRFNGAGQAARIVVNHRPLGSVLLRSQLMGEHFARTRVNQDEHWDHLDAHIGLRPSRIYARAGLLR